MTVSIFLLLQGQDLAQGYLVAKNALKAYFLSLADLLAPPSQQRPGNLGKEAFGGRARSLGGPGIPFGARSFWGLAAWVNLIPLVHNFTRSRALRKTAPSELTRTAKVEL